MRPRNRPRHPLQINPWLIASLLFFQERSACRRPRDHAWPPTIAARFGGWAFKWDPLGFFTSYQPPSFLHNWSSLPLIKLSRTCCRAGPWGIIAIPFCDFKEARLRFTTSPINQWQRVLLICIGGWGHANAIKNRHKSAGWVTGTHCPTCGSSDPSADEMGEIDGVTSEKKSVSGARRDRFSGEWVATGMWGHLRVGAPGPVSRYLKR